MVKTFSYAQFVSKRKFENFLISPLILAGRLISFLRPLEATYDIFFLFPFYHTGGAEKFNAAVANAVKGRRAIIFFTRKSSNTTFLKDFEDSGHRLIDISKYTDNKWLYFLNIVYRGIITGYLNRQHTKTIVFNGQCNFAYKISPWVKKEIIQLEFIHTFCTLSYIRPPFLSYYHHTISSSQKTINDHITYYKKSKVPDIYDKRFLYILYGIQLPPFVNRTDSEAKTIKVLFVGRGTQEKRVHIVALMAKKANEDRLPVQFEFMGDVKESIPDQLQAYCFFHGNKSDVSEIFSIYKQCHTLVITSIFEGFPFAVMEAMSQGLAILSTPVGDVPYHVKNDMNGYIIPELINEEIIVSEGVSFIRRLCNERKTLKNISKENQDYGYANFNITVFNKNYQKLLESFL